MSKTQFFKKLYRWVVFLLILLFFIIVVLYFAIQSPRFQTFVSQKVTQTLSNKLGTEISIDNVEIEFFNTINLDKLMVKDLENDTLFYFNNANAKLNYFSMFNNDISLNNINVDGLVVQLNRLKGDTAFNFDFLSQNKKVDSEESNSSPWEIILETIHFSNTKFVLNDSITGNNLNTKIPFLETTLNELNLEEKKFEVESILLEGPVISFTKSKTHQTVEPINLSIPALIYAENIQIKNGTFLFKNNVDTNSYKKMAFNDIDTRNIDIHLKDSYILNDSIYSYISNISLLEKSGFQLKKLNSKFEITNQILTAEKLTLETNQSNLRTDIQLKYKQFADFNDFVKKVKFETNIKSSLINPTDLQYFLDSKKLGIGGIFKVEGEIKGRIKSFRAKNIKLLAGNKTQFNGSFSLNGFPNFKETFISFKMDKLITDYQDLKFIYAKIPLPENTKTLGNIFFKGRFDGFANDFVSYGEAITDLGSLNTDINLKIDDSGIPKYSGNLNVKEFEIGEWFGIEDKIGAVSLQTSIKGKGIKLNTLNTELNGEIETISINGYIYKKLKVDGSIKDNFFKGNASIDDENIKMNFKGLVDATNKIPIFNFTAKLDTIQLKPLNLFDKDYIISGELNSNFSASSIDDVLGQLELDNVNISHKNKTYKLKNLKLNSELHQTEKHLDINGDNIDVLIHGDYQISSLSGAFKNIFVPNDSTESYKQNLRFDLKISDNSQLLALFAPKLKIPKDVIISGNLNSSQESLLTTISIPKLNHGKIKTKGFSSNIYVENGEIDVIYSLPEVKMNDSVLVKNLLLIAKGQKDNIGFNISASNNNQKTALEILGAMKYEDKTFNIKVDSNSMLLINNSFWEIDGDNLISFSQKMLKPSYLNISNSASEANFKVEKNNGINDLVLNLKNVEVEDFAEVLRNKGLDLSGKLNGEVTVGDFDKNPAIGGDLSFLNIELNDYSIGDFNIDSRVDLDDKKVYLIGGLFSKENHIDITGAISLDKISTNEDFNVDINIKQFTVKSLEDLIPHFIHSSSGTLDGNLKLYGPRKEPNLNGFVNVNDVTTTVTYTQVQYTIAETKIDFIDNQLVLADTVTLQDSEGNVAYGTGKILHQNLKDWALDLEVTTDKVKALNTQLVDNDAFYGSAYIKGGASFVGSTFEPLIYIYGESEEGSYIDVPLLDDVSNTQHEFYQFITKEKKEEKLEEEEFVRVVGAKVKLDLSLNEDLELKIILDQEAGDILKVKGSGNVRIDVGQGAEFVNFYGDYLITEGDYLFTMQNVVNKPFKIKPNSTINFNGNIYDEATIDISATYTRKVALDNFISEYLAEDDVDLRSIASNRVPVTLLLDLNDKLSKPIIKFDIEIDRIDPQIRSYVDSKLETIKTNESEMNNQIFGVLVLSRFLPSYSALGNSITGSNDVGDLAINTVSELLSSQISRYITDWASYLITDLEFQVDFTSYDDLSAITLQKRRDLQLALSKRFFNDRLSINVGGNFDFGEKFDDNQTTNATFFGANVSFEYAFTKNRRWLIKAFTVSDYDSYTEDNRRTKSGIGLSYKREFDDIYDLFNVKKKPKKTRNENSKN